jgi:corticotropin releasing hormone receptor 1
MFVEGLYLYILVVRTFSIELVNLLHYYLIGYGLPAVVMTVWIPIKWNYGSLNPALGFTCVYQGKDDTDFIYAIPFVIVLAVNCFFLGKIMYVLITKLRSSTTAESQQYRKAAKALLVLIPLLGLSYLLLVTQPQEKLAKIIVTYMHAILFSTQVSLTTLPMTSIILLTYRQTPAGKQMESNAIIRN